MKIRFQEKDNEQLISLEKYKAVKEAFRLWEEVNQTRDEYHLRSMKALDVFLEKYHVAGVNEEWKLEELEDRKKWVVQDKKEIKALEKWV